ncbi:MAG: 50S ribosome-binding GTPase, partial [Clostridia bacterium]|nr:50S ribosome-binding GTPase [Clostridia bacterium]
DEQITLARSGLDGRLSAESERIYNSLCDILAAIYAHIDYPDEDLADIPRDEMLRVARENLSALEKLSRTYSTAHAIGEGIPTVILGRTNAGKSTLYNRIVGRDAAIVTDIEGTTRDVLTETAHLGRVTLRLSDTAGLRQTDDKVESIGIERARREAENAELILFVLDSSRNPDEEDRAMIDYISTLAGVKVALLNKSDINTNVDFSSLLSSFALTLPISAENGYGFDRLEAEIEKIYIDNELDMGHGAIIANARQNAAVTNAISALSGAISAIEGDLPLEICCVEVENSLSALGELDGRTVTEDIISKIFANFCVGK